MFKPLRPNPDRKQTSNEKVLPAPTKGWYVGANLADAPEGTAYILDNAFPQLDYIRFRRGTAAYATGMPSAAVSTLIPYQGSSGVKFFAFCNGNIYDVTNTGAVGAAVVTGLNSSAYIEYTQFTGTGGTYVLLCNGVDAPPNYSIGSGWGVTAITGTGLTSSNLVFPWSFKNRLYFAEINTLNAWYLALDSIGGTATKFALTSVFKYGGSLVCGFSWPISSNSGLYEVCGFLSSEGEIAIYDGADPTTWTLKGTYKISKPLGRRCLMKAGGDIAVVTEDGIVPLSQIWSLDQIALQNVAITKPIAPAWRQAVLDRTGIAGWQIVSWPLESMAVVNLPKMNTGDRTQFVANARTGAWARYLNWDANCFAVYNSNLYYGTSDGRIMQAETGGQDDGGNYTVTVFPSYNRLGSAARKQVKMVRPRLQASFPVLPQVTTRVDYDTTTPAAPTATAVSGFGALWDVALWDVAIWAPTLADQSFWRDAEGVGNVVSPVMQLTLSTTQTPDIRLTANEILYAQANIIG